MVTFFACFTQTLVQKKRMGKQNGVGETKFKISGERVGSRLLQGVEGRIRSSRPIPSQKQERIDQILKELESSSKRMEQILGVFNRIKGGM